MSYYLYLDDKRTPKTDKDWIIVRDYESFCATLDEMGCPAYVSFDHDLACYAQDGMEYTGKHCAHALIDRAMDRGWDLRKVEFNVHSANPVGAKSIESLLRNYISFLDAKI